jgi:uncharacterized MAPEG superfamily protein
MGTLAEMPTEIVLLGWGVVLLLVQLVLYATPAVLELGIGYALSPRDEGRRPKGVVTCRLGRAFANLMETFPAFAALALALAVTGKAGGLGAAGAHIWFWSRVVYVPVYALGIPGLRTAVWTVALVGIILMLIALLA